MRHQPSSLFSSERPFFTDKRRPAARSFQQMIYRFVLALFLFSGIIGSWVFVALRAYAAGIPQSPPASMTFQQFMKQGYFDKAYHGQLINRYINLTSGCPLIRIYQIITTCQQALSR